MLSDYAIASLPSLEHLDLSHNWIDGLGWQVFALDGPSHLKTLDLSRNRLDLVPAFAFGQLYRLELLKLNDNRIGGEIDKCAFWDPPHLKDLNLSRNELTTLGDQAFHFNSELESLWLHSNAIARIHPNALPGLSGLRALSLSRNALTELPEAVFADLAGLRHLWLYGNRLSHLALGLFAGLFELRTLSLSGNSLDALDISDNPVFEPLPADVCTVLGGVETLRAEGIEVECVCP